MACYTLTNFIKQWTDVSKEDKNLSLWNLWMKIKWTDGKLLVHLVAQHKSIWSVRENKKVKNFEAILLIIII